MTSLIRFYQNERKAKRAAQNVVQLQLEPSLEYRLALVVYVADMGFGASPRYAVETFSPDRGSGSLEYEGNDGAEAIRVALDQSNNSNAYGVRFEFVGPADLSSD